MVVAPEMATAMVTGPLPGSIVPSNANSVNYFDENKQVYLSKSFYYSSCKIMEINAYWQFLFRNYKLNYT